MTRAVHGFGLLLNRRKTADKPLSLQKQLAISFLAILLLSSAFSVIYLKDLSRRLFIQYQTLQSTQQTDELKRNKLLLEQGAFRAQSRIQTIAAHQLNMITPSAKQIVTIRD